MYFCYQNSIIMSQAAYTIRLDSDLKNRFDTLCEGFGMSASTAFNIFVRTVVRKRRIPFEIEMSEADVAHEEGRRAFLEIRKMAEQGAFPDLTLDEINEEIQLAREGK
jgi:DNA-damage-inducible protein J